MYDKIQRMGIEWGKCKYTVIRFLHYILSVKSRQTSKLRMHIVILRAITKKNLLKSIDKFNAHS